MFESMEMAPTDPILGLTEIFKADPRPEKINLCVGVFKDASGNTPILECVKRAERVLLDQETSKSYLEMAGMKEFGVHVNRLLFGADSPIGRGGLAMTAQTPGGTAALRVAADLVKTAFPRARVWMSDPTWANHDKVFRAAGLDTGTYPYYDFDGHVLAFDRLKKALAAVPAGDLVLLHACCHNPSGMDPGPGQWRELADLSARQGFLPLFDFAYQGFGDGIEPDAAGLRCFAQPGREFLVASSYSKNFGLYNERVGALTVVAAAPDAAEKAFSRVKACVRANYSNPPFHGAAVVRAILDRPELAELWGRELRAMCARIQDMRRLFAKGMTQAGARADFSFITRQRGMFSFLGLSRDHVLKLRDRHAIYLVESSRINVAGMTPENLDRVCRAIADVTAA